MSITWHGDAPPPAPPQPAGAGGWALALGRGAALGGVTFGCLGLLLALRLAERPLFGRRRPWTPRITQFVCRAAFVIIGIKRRVRGRPIAGPGAMLANHASWLDIFTLNASARVVFVSKAEVADWPGIGWLARATGTLFIRRDRRAVTAEAARVAERLAEGQLLLLFPEGTSSDGRRVLPFRPALLAPLAEADAQVQPVSVIYTAPPGADPRFYGWWGGMEFGPHLLSVLAARRQGTVEVVYHPPLAAGATGDRKALACAAEAAVRAGFEAGAGRG